MIPAKTAYVYDYLSQDWEITENEVQAYFDNPDLLKDDNLEPEFVEHFHEACREYESQD